ncbi:dienelactone hydrolase family protein [Massilia sp. CF038]|uniref:dienelactone hydrolase family protein n=1 Tax=Massilia sp. CF038 TaxID=1881045 RepID=UPI001E2A3AC2|nr:CocE/NonD family hydrolase [Massilia sp. CF038]
MASISLACLCFTPLLAVEQELAIDARLNEQIIMVPAGSDGQARLQTTVFRPNGPGPFPLLIINHGKDTGEPQYQQRDRFIYMATAFVKRGYAVLVPMRQGFANSSGSYANHGCNMTANGQAQADDVLSTIAFARQQKWIDSDRIVVAGQSYGGLATIALGTRDVPGVRGLINFAGGLRDDGAGCDWRGELVQAFANYGANSKVPSLWMYGVNDSLFGPDLVSRMYGAYVGQGGHARLHEFGVFKRDSHGMIASRDGEKIWWKETEPFLREVGMPTEEKYAVITPPPLPKTNFARLDDIAAVPYLQASGREAYREYLARMTPRAFAVSPTGDWCWAEEGENPDARALETCGKKSNQPCKLYSVDDYVVWQGSTPVDTAATAVGGSGQVGSP